MKLCLVLNYKGVVLVGDCLGEFGRDCVVGSFVLEDKTFVALDTTKNGGLLNRPGSDVSPLLLSVLLLCVGWLPSRLPVVCELLQERGFEGRGLVIDQYVTDPSPPE